MTLNPVWVALTPLDLPINPINNNTDFLKLSKPWHYAKVYWGSLNMSVKLQDNNCHLILSRNNNEKHVHFEQKTKEIVGKSLHRTRINCKIKRATDLR